MESASAAVDGFLHLLVSQLATRLLTFLLNLLSTRSLTPEAYGVAAVQFHLINTTILFVSREGFRRGCLRVGPSDPRATRRVLGVATLTLPLGAALSAAVTALLLQQQQAKADGAYRQALLMQGAAAFLEICAEPLYILASTRLLFRLRVAVETAATVAKGALLLGLLQATATLPAVAFSWAQLAYAGVVLAGYMTYFAPQALESWRQRRRQQTQRAGRGKAEHAAGGGTWAPDGQLLRVSGVFTFQAVEKLFLAEGSKMVMAAAQGRRAQGVYGLVTNLGSLVVRTLFQPFEEAAFTAFSKAAAAAEGGMAASPTGPAACRPLTEQWRLLALLVRSITTVGLLAAAFGPGYAYLTLLAAYSRRWADTGAPAALGLYSQYIALLAANGILEAFVHSVASQRQLQRINLWLVAFSALHLGASVAAVRAWGTAGLILADSANMAARIAYCLAFVAARFAGAEGFALRDLLPARLTLAALAAAFLVTGASRLALLYDSAGLWAWWQKRASSGGAGAATLPLRVLEAALGGLGWRVRAGLHVLVGAACLAGVAAVLLARERDVLRQLRRVRRAGSGGGAVKEGGKEE